MGLQCYFGGTTIQTLKLAAIPASSAASSSRFIFKPICKTPTLNFLPRQNIINNYNYHQRPTFTLLCRALSATAAVQAAPTAESVDNKGSFFFGYLFSLIFSLAKQDCVFFLLFIV